MRMPVSSRHKMASTSPAVGVEAMSPRRMAFASLGYQFSPRIADIGGARFWRIDPKAEYGPLNNFASHKVRMGLIAQYWDDLLRLADSLKLGLVQAGGLMRTLQTHDRPTPLARALEELGRIIKIVLDIEEHYAAIRPGIPAEPRQLLKRYIEQGRLGIKSGKGFYSDYEEKAPTR